MTKQYNISDSHATVALNVSPIDVTDWTLLDTKLSDDGLVRESFYQNIVQSAAYTNTLRVGIYRNPKALGGYGQTNYSVKFGFTESEFWGEGSSETIRPANVTLAFSVPGCNGVLPGSDEAKLAYAICQVFSAVIPLQNNEALTDTVHAMSLGISSTLLLNAVVDA